MRHERRAGVRLALVIGGLAAVGALSPLAAVAQEQPQPSGAQIELGGVGTTSPAVSGTGAVTSPVSRTAPTGAVTTAPTGAVTTAPAGAQVRPVVLPNTGTGPGDETTYAWALALVAGVAALGGGVYLNRRGRRSRAVS